MEKQQDGFARRGARYRNVCKPCHSVSKLAWSAANKEKRAASVHLYYAKKVGKHSDECRARQVDPETALVQKRAKRREDYQKNRACYLKNAKDRAVRLRAEISAYNSEWRALNRDKKRTADKLWRERNATKLNSYYSARRDRRRKSEPAWLNAIERAQIQEMYDVAAARTMQTGVKHHVDHIHPLKGDGFNGLHVPWNLCVLTAAKNLSKGARFPACDAHLLWGT
tara:strand:+ start:128 stop:802 length:675 start_codon:yes stop_codon:yes gene_type:complete